VVERDPRAKHVLRRNLMDRTASRGQAGRQRATGGEVKWGAGDGHRGDRWGAAGGRRRGRGGPVSGGGARCYSAGGR